MCLQYLKYIGKMTERKYPKLISQGSSVTFGQFSYKHFCFYTFYSSKVFAKSATFKFRVFLKIACYNLYFKAPMLCKTIRVYNIT